MQPAVRQADRDLDLHLAVGRAQDGADVVLHPEAVRGQLEPVRDDLVVGDLRARRLAPALGVAVRLAGRLVVLGRLPGVGRRCVGHPGLLARGRCTRRTHSPHDCPAVPRARLALRGAIAQLGERLLCKQEVAGSIPAGSMARNPCYAAELGALRHVAPAGFVIREQAGNKHVLQRSGGVAGLAPGSHPGGRGSESPYRRAAVAERVGCGRARGRAAAVQRPSSQPVRNDDPSQAPRVHLSGARSSVVEVR